MGNGNPYTPLYDPGESAEEMHPRQAAHPGAQDGEVFEDLVSVPFSD